jgi:hypothetical protein
MGAMWGLVMGHASSCTHARTSTHTHTYTHTCTCTQVVSLADNYISTLEGLGSLRKLRDLNLARNDISHIGDALSANTALQVLNLADNNIGSFKVRAELINGQRAASLQEQCRRICWVEASEGRGVGGVLDPEIWRGRAGLDGP